jgi:hypothetical protein
MPKKTTILIAVLAIVTAVLLFLAITQGTKQLNNNQTATPTPHVVEKTAKVFFNPQNVDLAGGSATPESVDIMVDTGTGEAAGVQAEMQFDPKALTNVKLVPASDASGFFGAGANVLFNDVNPTTGRISYAIAIAPSQNSHKGVGKIATLTFQRSLNATGSATKINFLDKTLVTVLGENESVLNEALPLNITFTNSATTPNTVAPVISPVTTTIPVATTAPTQ